MFCVFSQFEPGDRLGYEKDEQEKKAFSIPEIGRAPGKAPGGLQEELFALRGTRRGDLEA